jgi:3,4-dihydroxy-2-butanone 4-phosphate synthase
MTVLSTLDTGIGALVDLRATSAETRALDRVAVAVATLGHGRAVIMCDNADNPSRGDVVYAAEHASTELTAMTIRHTSGFLHVALDAARCNECNELGLVAQRGADTASSRQCVTVDAKDYVGTGISAVDRAATARLLGSQHATADAFTRPGHVVPLRARMNLPPRRYGVAEGAVRLSVDAGLSGAAVMCTVVGVKDPTIIAAGDELIEFAHSHALPLVSVGDLAVVHNEPCLNTQSAHLSAGSVRLICIDDDGEDAGFACLAVGEIADRSAVPLRVIPTQQLLLNAVRDDSGPAILIGAHGDTPTDALANCARLEAAVQQPDSRIRDVVRSLGARSVWLGQSCRTTDQRELSERCGPRSQ